MNERIFYEDHTHIHTLLYCTSIVVNEKDIHTCTLHPNCSCSLACAVFCDIHLPPYPLPPTCTLYVYLPLSLSATFSAPPLYPAQPFIRGPPVDLTVNQSHQATFSCTAQGNPVPTISWTGPSTNFTTEVTPGANFTVLSVLTIDSAVRAVHEGLYTCSASNGVEPSPSSNAALTVQGTAGDPPPHNTRCTVDLPHQQTTLHTAELLSCVVSSSSSLLSSPPPQFPPMCKPSREGLWVSRQ